MNNQVLTLYHNPRCSKSRQALTLLQEHGVTPVIVEYLVQPPDRGTLQNIVDKLANPPTDLIRSQDAKFKELALDVNTLSNEQCLDLLCEYPELLQRPVIVSEQTAIIGRPPERVLELL